MRAAAVIAVLTAALLWNSAPLGLASPFLPYIAQDEAVYSHAAMRMAEAGEWSTPRFLGRYFLYKPPLLYWLAGVPAKLFGPYPWALRMPSILASSLVAAIVFWWARRLSGGSLWRGIAGWLLLLASPMFRDLGARAMTDAVLVLAIVASAALPVEYLAACVAVGTLVKSIGGLIPILITGLGWVLLRERPPLARVAGGAVLGLLIAAPWFVYQWETHRRWLEAECIGVELLAYGTAPPPVGGPSSAQFYVTTLWAVAAPLCLAFVAALPRFDRRSTLAAALIVMTAAVFGYQYRNATYLLPLLPLLAVAGAASAPKWALAISAAVAVWSNATPTQPLAGEATFRAAERYAALPTTRDLIVVGIDDQFSISTLPALHGRLRYAIQGAARSEGQVTLDFVSMGIVVPAAAFPPDPARFAPKLREWGLNDNAALGTVISWETPEDLAALIRANPDRDFLLPASLPPPTPPSSHCRVTAPPGAVLLLSPASRAGCRMMP
ncbi:MAG: hypothetical protein FJW31_17835 [Acidobacteria bacterium]|nr:hypothetical protein [Acidobacteriota bacterium]